MIVKNFDKHTARVYLKSGKEKNIKNQALFKSYDLYFEGKIYGKDVPKVVERYLDMAGKNLGEENILSWLISENMLLESDENFALDLMRMSISKNSKLRAYVEDKKVNSFTKLFYSTLKNFKYHGKSISPLLIKKLFSKLNS